MRSREPQTILGHLGTRQDVMRAGEVLLTMGLAWLLRDPAAAEAMSALLGCASPLEWEGETPAGDFGRIDLVGWGEHQGRSHPIAVVEAKIHHTLTRNQIAAYLAWQHMAIGDDDTVAHVVAILLPASRRSHAMTIVDQLDSVPIVVTWSELFDQLGSADLADATRADLDQLIDFYWQLDAQWIEPFSLEETREDWAGRCDDYVALSALVTIELRACLARATGRSAKLLPWNERHRQALRYVLVDHEKGTFVAVGVFEGALDGVPFAVRYHTSTGGFSGVRQRLLKDESLSVEQTGDTQHVYVRLALKPNASQQEVLSDLRRQIGHVLRVAHPDLPRIPDFEEMGEL